MAINLAPCVVYFIGKSFLEIWLKHVVMQSVIYIFSFFFFDISLYWDHFPCLAEEEMGIYALLFYVEQNDIDIYQFRVPSLLHKYNHNILRT